MSLRQDRRLRGAGIIVGFGALVGVAWFAMHDQGGDVRTIRLPDPSIGTATIPSDQVKGCASRPSSCGYPDESNTGVADGVSLRAVPGEITSGPGWHYDSRGSITVDTDGAVVEGIVVSVDINVTADNVTIRNCRVTVSGADWGIASRSTNRLTIEDSEVRGASSSGKDRILAGIKDVYGDSTNMKILRTNIWNAATGIQLDSGLIQDNYIHDLGYADGDHNNGIMTNGGSRQLVVRHNTVFNPHAQTDAIGIFQDFGPQSNKLIDNNLLAGGGYAIYGGANPGKEDTATNIKISNNRISRKFFERGGKFGPATAYNPGGTSNSWVGNIWDEDGSLVLPNNP